MEKDMNAWKGRKCMLPEKIAEIRSRYDSVAAAVFDTKESDPLFFEPISDEDAENVAPHTGRVD